MQKKPIANSFAALVVFLRGLITGFAAKAVLFLKGAPKIKEIPEYVAPDIEVDASAAALYERMYFDTLETRENLVARLQVPLAVALSLVGAQSYMILATDFSKTGWVFSLYAIFLAIAFFTILRTSQHFFGVLSGHSYRFIPTPSDFEDFRQRAVEKFSDESPGSEWIEHWVNLTLRREILKHMITCATFNALRNDLRSGRSWRGHVLLMYSGVFTAMAFAAFHLGSLREIPVHRVQVVAVGQGNGPAHPVDLVDSIRLKGNNALGANLIFEGLQDE